jgi:hypothetical protein
MSIPLNGRLHWRHKAPFHIQMAITEILSDSDKRYFSNTRIEGTAVKVFRTDGRLAIGDYIAIYLYVCHPGNEPTGPAFVYDKDLENAEYMEAYLVGDPPKYGIAGYEFDIISAPTEQPTLTPRELEELIRCLGH